MGFGTGPLVEVVSTSFVIELTALLPVTVRIGFSFGTLAKDICDAFFVEREDFLAVGAGVRALLEFVVADLTVRAVNVKSWVIRQGLWVGA